MMPGPEIVEITIYAQRYSNRWYPVGSDTPVPTIALVEKFDQMELEIDGWKLCE